MSTSAALSTAQLWKRERFPMVYQSGEPTAVLVDVASFAQIELMLDNLLHRDAEPEDSLLSQSEALPQLLAHDSCPPVGAGEALLGWGCSVMAAKDWMFGCKPDRAPDQQMERLGAISEQSGVDHQSWGFLTCCKRDQTPMKYSDQRNHI